MNAELSDADRASAAYAKRSLAPYNWWELGVVSRCIWKCPTEEILELYSEHLSQNHLEVGVGTGFFLEKSLYEGYPRIVLIDSNSDSLVRAAKKLAEFKPETHQENILEPLDLTLAPFDSISINYVLHGLPGSLELKAEKVFDHLIPLLKNDGTIFGTTVLGAEIKKPLLANLWMNFYNRKGIFSNTQDSLGAIMENLSSRFKTFNVEVHGCVVLFSGKGLKESIRRREEES